MGILNVTPDSFSDGGRYTSLKHSIKHIEHMVQQGADIIDIGGESTRPGSKGVSAQIETERVLPVLKKALACFPQTAFSVDTRKYEVAEQSLKAGAHFINDVSGLREDPEKAELCGVHKAGLIIMHSQKDPQTMQENPQYDNVIEEVKAFLRKQTQFARSRGVEQIIIDPGFGFGKTTRHNMQIIAKLASFKELGYPVLIGASRKSSIGKIVGTSDPERRIAGTLAVHYHALIQSADILRVHDVQEAKDSVLIFNAINKND